MNDIELERALVEEQAQVAHSLEAEKDEMTPEEEHSEAQKNGEVFEGQQNGGAL